MLALGVKGDANMALGKHGPRFAGHTFVGHPRTSMHLL